MRLPHQLQGQKVKSQGGAGAYCGSHLAAQLVYICNCGHYAYKSCTLVYTSHNNYEQNTVTVMHSNTQ